MSYALALLGAAGELALDQAGLPAPFVEVLLCTSPPLAPRLQALGTPPTVSLVGPLIPTGPDGLPLAQLTAALSVAGAEQVVALDAALLDRLHSEDLAALTEPRRLGARGDGAVDVLRLHRSLDRAPGFTPACYHRRCRRALERALRRGRYAPADALKGLRSASLNAP